MSSTTRTIDQLGLSPLNVRTYSPDAEDTEGLQASILAEGLLNPIAVHPMKGSKTKWGAVAGGRRYRAIKALVARGALPPEWPVKVTILEGLSDAQLIEHSITENLLRRDLRDHELFAGVARAAARGHDARQIAHNLGQPDVAKVARWLRLGQLAEPIFAAFAQGRISVDQAKAFAATEDKELQLATFKRFERLDVNVPSPADIRRAMAFGDEASKRELLFVGDAAYRGAGGAFELDLFAEDAEERGRVANPGKLRELVDVKLGEVRDQVRATVQDTGLRFVPEPPQDEWKMTDHQLAVSPKKLASGTLQLPEGDVVAHIRLDHTGEPIVTYWWSSRKAKYGIDKAKPTRTTPPPGPAGSAISDPYAGKPRADAAIRREEGLSQDAIFALSAVRRTMLRAGLVDDATAGGDVGRDYLVWAQARSLFTAQAMSAHKLGPLGMRGIVGPNMVGVSADAIEMARKQVEETEAARICAVAIGAISAKPFMALADLDAAFADYREEDDETKRMLAAIVAGLALERSLAAPGYVIPVHDVVAAEAGIDRDEVLRGYWSPTTEMLDAFPKEQRRAFAEPFVSAGDLATWAKLKSQELTAAVLRVLTRAGRAGASWVHPLLRFGGAVDAPNARSFAQAAE